MLKVSWFDFLMYSLQYLQHLTHLTQHLKYSKFIKELVEFINDLLSLVQYVLHKFLTGICVVSSIRKIASFLKNL